jgi:hypothetical protein
MRGLLATLVISSVLGTTTAPACGPGTVALIERVVTMDEPPRYKCGAEFNDMLARAQKKDWKGALAAYEKHLANLGRWEVDSANASETLAYLRKKSAGR